MDYPIIAYLVLVVVTLPRVEGQFPRVCTDRGSLRDKKCCPTPKGFTTQCGYDGGVLFTTKSANATRTLQVTIAANARLVTMAVPARRRKI